MQINLSKVGKDRFLKLLLPDFLNCFSLPPILLVCLKTDGTNWPSLHKDGREKPLKKSGCSSSVRPSVFKQTSKIGGTDGRTDRVDALTNRHWPNLPVKENSNILISNN